MSKAIVVSSGKGGVGKTTTSVNLAFALNNLGKKTVLVDSNLTTPNVGLHLGSSLAPVTLNHVLQGKKHIYDAVYEHKSGIKVVPASISLSSMHDIKPVILNKSIEYLKKIADFIILDSAAGLGSEALLALNALSDNDDILIIANPDMPSIVDALKTIKIAEKLGKNVKGIVITRARNDKNELANKSIKAMLEKPILIKIPEDDCVRKSIMMKIPVVISHPKSKSAESYKRLASKIAGVPYKNEGGFFSSFFEKIFRQ